LSFIFHDDERGNNSMMRAAMSGSEDVLVR
jgi:hypothetical protein